MDDPGMFRVSRESTDTLTGGVGSQASMDDPGMFRVSRESMDTLTGGVGSQASMDDPGRTPRWRPWTTLPKLVFFFSQPWACAQKFFVQCGPANCLLGAWGPVIPFACKQLQLVYQQYEKRK